MMCTGVLENLEIPGLGPEPVIGPRFARTRWGHAGITKTGFGFSRRS